MYNFNFTSVMSTTSQLHYLEWLRKTPTNPSWYKWKNTLIRIDTEVATDTLFESQRANVNKSVRRHVIICSKVDTYFHRNKKKQSFVRCVIFFWSRLLHCTTVLHNRIQAHVAEVTTTSDKHRHTRSLLCICAGAGLGWWSLTTVAPHYVRGRRTHYHQRCAGQTKRLQETKEHRRNHD